MGLLKGSMTFRRYTVNGEVPTDFRERYQQLFTDNAFAVRPGEGSKLEYTGWTTVHNLLDSDFSNLSQWFVEPYILAMFRLDVKTVPNNLFRAMTEEKCQEWCNAHNKERCPASVKSEIKDVLKSELLQKTLPRIKTVEWCWDLQQNQLFVHNVSETMNERFRTFFYHTFGMTLTPYSPLSLLDSVPETALKIEQCGLSELQLFWEDNQS